MVKFISAKSQSLENRGLFQLRHPNSLLESKKLWNMINLMIKPAVFWICTNKSIIMISILRFLFWSFLKLKKKYCRTACQFLPIFHLYCKILTDLNPTVESQGISEDKGITTCLPNSLPIHWVQGASKF